MSESGQSSDVIEQLEKDDLVAIEHPDSEKNWLIAARVVQGGSESVGIGVAGFGANMHVTADEVYAVAQKGDEGYDYKLDGYLKSNSRGHVHPIKELEETDSPVGEVEA
jgi:hypothetical protein